MLKSQAPRLFRRGFAFRSTNNSIIAQRAARDGNETINTPRVYFKKRVITNSRMIGCAVVAGGAYAFLLWFDGIIDDLDLKEERGRDQEEKEEEPAKAARPKSREDDMNTEASADNDDDEEKAEESLIFFPTGLPRPKPRTYYKGSDPEWQEFVRISKDAKRVARIRGQLVGLIRRMAARNPEYVMYLGKIQAAKGAAFIHIHFPDGPPIEYERPGYELTEGLNVRKTTRDIERVHLRHLQRLLYPTAIANTIYLDSRRRATLLLEDIRKYMGWAEPTLGPSQKVPIQKPLDFPASLESPPPITTSASSTPSSSTPNRADANKPLSSPGALSNSTAERFGLTLPDLTRVPMLDLSYFRQRLNFEYTHNVAKIYPTTPHGTILATGIVEVVGERRKLAIDVVAEYDPKRNEYIGINAKLRYVEDLQKGPKGGP